MNEVLYYMNNGVRAVECKDMYIMANTSNQAVIGLKKEQVKIWDAAQKHTVLKKSDIPDDLFEAMLELNFISQNIEEQNDEKMNILSAYVHVTNKCNLHCIGCYSYDSKRNHASDMSLEQLRIVVSRLKDAGLKCLVISGGEPFIRQDLYDFVKYCQEIGIEEINIISNGTVRTDFKKFKDIVNEISISVDGYSDLCPTFIRDSGIFNQVCETVKIIKQSGVPVSILPTLHSKNWNKIDEYMKLANEMGVSVNFSLLSVCESEVFKGYIPNVSQQIGLADELYHVNVPVQDASIDCNLEAGLCCGAGRTIISVGTDGTIYPCHMLHTDEYRMGNILETPIKMDQLDKNVMNVINDVTVDKIDGCQTCEYRYFCSGGCRARSYFKYGDLFHKDGYCELSKHFYDMVTTDLVREIKGKKKSNEE